MGRWAGWGAGPAGAGSAGGPSRIFLLAALVGSAAVAAVLFADGRGPEGLVAALAAVYFGLRATGRLGPRRR